MLSKKAQYSLYALVKLAKEEGSGPVLIKDIAESENLPKKFLEAILVELKNKGIVSSKRGKGGGYYLRKKPEEINLAEIVRCFDGALAYLPCVSLYYYERCEYCKDEEKCGVKSVFSDIRSATAKILENTSIADIIRREDDLNT